MADELEGPFKVLSDQITSMGIKFQTQFNDLSSNVTQRFDGVHVDLVKLSQKVDNRGNAIEAKMKDGFASTDEHLANLKRDVGILKRDVSMLQQDVSEIKDAVIPFDGKALKRKK